MQNFSQQTDTLPQAQKKLQKMTDDALKTVDNTPSRLMENMQYRRAYFMVKEAELCNAEGDTDRLNTLLEWTTLYM